MSIQEAIFPKRLEIELSSKCNLHCVYCPRNYVENLNGYMELELFKKIIEETANYPQTVIVLHRRGESMLHPMFNEILYHVANKFEEVQMATNSTLLTQDKFEAIVKGLTFLSFSLDPPATYNKTRIPAKYDKVERNILNFLEFNKGRVRTQASMVKTDNVLEEDVLVFKEIWRDRVDRVRIYEEHSINGVFGAMQIPRKNRQPCVMPSYEILIYDNGHVGRCNHDWNGDPMGDLNHSTIREIWHNRKYEDLREQHQRLEFKDIVCKECDSWYPEIGIQGTGEVLEK
ncbi:MAG: radical SAM protein [Nitrospirae bacterium]|nr:radical SAM protein [Nitrospirota bacterium]